MALALLAPPLAAAEAGAVCALIDVQGEPFGLKNEDDRLYAELQRRGACPALRRIESLGEEAADCDAVLGITVRVIGRFSFEDSVEILSPVSNKIIETRTQATAPNNYHSGLEELVRGACGQLRPGGGAFLALQAERRRLAPSRPEPPTPPPPQAAGVDEEKMRRMIAQAVREAAQPAAPVQAAAASDVDAPKYRRAENPANFALIVGIEQYSDLPPAAFAERDAVAVRRHAVALGFPERNILYLTGARATRTGLVKNLETWLARNVRPESSVLFYYSGHGAPDPRTGRAYLVPWDGDPQFLEESGYPVERLYAKLGALKAKQVIVAMDACFSGSGNRSVLAKGLRPLVTRVELGAVPAKVAALTATQADQVAGAYEEQGHGLFTYFFLRGLNEGQRTTRALHEFLGTRVQDAARRQNLEQTPTVAGADAAF